MIDPNSKISIPDRADQRYALCSSMVYNVWRGKTKDEKERLLDGFFRISLALSSDFAAMAMIDAMHGIDPHKQEEYSRMLIEHKSYKNWQKKHGTALKHTMQASAS